jgi:methanogenic corrinoid protein MtbC1
VSASADGTRTLRDAYLAALLASDPRRARKLVSDAVASGTAPEELYLDVFQPALHEVGHRWAVGELSVADEHLARGVN